MPWYSTGSVDVSAGSATVTGTGTAFSANGRVGDAFRGPDGLWYEVTNIASATVLSIKPSYQGATATGQTYAIAPMQGYVKESADRLRQFVDQYGATLGSLGDWSTAATADAALTALGFTASGKGVSTGTPDQALTALGFSASGKTVASGTPEQGRQALGALSTTGTAADSSKLGGTEAAQFYRRSNILGVVSQLNGVPTGAIIDRGSNANGEFMRLADGRQICTTRQSGNFPPGASSIAWIFPAQFIVEPQVHCTYLGGASGALRPGIEGNGVSQCSGFMHSSASGSISGQLMFTATGRWY